MFGGRIVLRILIVGQPQVIIHDGVVRILLQAVAQFADGIEVASLQIIDPARVSMTLGFLGSCSLANCA